MARPKGWTRHFARELWRSSHAELITVITTIAFGLADVASSTTLFTWSAAAVLILVGYSLYILREARLTADATIGTVEMPYSIVTNKPIGEAEPIFGNHERVMSERGTRLDVLFSRFRISNTDWRYFDQNRVDDEHWKDLVRDARSHFLRYSKRIPTNVRYHFFFVTPSAIALAFGAVVGRDIRSKAYQYFGPGGFQAVFDPESRGEAYHSLRSPVSDYRQLAIEATGDPESQDVAVILQFGHPLSPIGTTLGSSPHCLSVSHNTHVGHLPANSDWMALAVELGSLILAQVKLGKNVHVFVGLPTALAYAVGYIVGDHNRIMLYHHDKHRDQYIKVFSLNELA